MLKGKKTAIFSLLLVIFGGLEGFDFTKIIDSPEVSGWILSGIGAIVFILRSFTTTPVGKSE